MRGMGSILGLLVVALICAMAYKYFFTSGQSVGATTPSATIDAVGAQNDLIAIAQAERMYQAQNGKYASLDDLISGGAMNLRKPNREGYVYDVDASEQNFVATARCTSSAPVGCHNYSVDPTMSVHVTP